LGFCDDCSDCGACDLDFAVFCLGFAVFGLGFVAFGLGFVAYVNHLDHDLGALQSRTSGTPYFVQNCGHHTLDMSSRPPAPLEPFYLALD
jgi:hypothetical protein